MQSKSLKPIDELRKRLKDISHMSAALSLLYWDRDVNIPKKVSDSRAETLAHLSGIIHEKFVSLDSDSLLTNLKKDVEAKRIKGNEAVIVMETCKTFDREKKLPENFVKEMAEISSKAGTAWAEARSKNDFKMFLPWLTKIIALKRKEAEYIGYTESPYDALLDAFEPGMTSREVALVLNDLKNFLTPFIKKIQSSRMKINSKKLVGDFPIEKQKVFNEMVVRKMGFDFDAGRIDASTHPFAIGLHPYDTRITTRYSEKDLFYSLGPIIHEAGHGLYEQGLPAEYFGTPLAEVISVGIHESQSRTWENLIGKSKSFWKYFYPKLQKEFPKPFATLPFSEFYKIINKVQPSLVRTESDEVTYNLHIIIRFEIEKEMIEGTIDLKDLPEIWKAKMKEYLEIEVPNDSLGVLQDVHWSLGAIGYFPTYTLGNLYSAQFFNAMRRTIPDIDSQISRGEFKEIREWLRKNIHSQGKTYTTRELLKKLTGEDLTSSYFVEYLQKKYDEIYFK